MQHPVPGDHGRIVGLWGKKQSSEMERWKTRVGEGMLEI